jgi:hypothetical protein
MTDPIERFLTHIPPLFLRNLLEQMDAAFAKALRLTNEHYAEPERAGMLGQSRHACCEEGFRRAAYDAGLEARAPHTKPAGGRYSLVERGGFTWFEEMCSGTAERLGRPSFAEP